MTFTTASHPAAAWASEPMSPEGSSPSPTASSQKPPAKARLASGPTPAMRASAPGVPHRR